MSNGNQSFTKIYNTNNQFSTLTVGDLNASNVDATVINGEQMYTITGYTPINFSTGTEDQIFALMKTPNQLPATSSNDSRLLIIPSGAAIYKVIVSNNNDVITGGTNFNIGAFQVAEPFIPIIGFPLLQNTTLASVNSGCYRLFLRSAEPPADNAGFDLLITDRRFFGSVQILNNANTTGQIKVSVTYFFV